jgi:hypothetical protein
MEEKFVCFFEQGKKTFQKFRYPDLLPMGTIELEFNIHNGAEVKGHLAAVSTVNGVIMLNVARGEPIQLIPPPQGETVQWTALSDDNATTAFSTNKGLPVFRRNLNCSGNIVIYNKCVDQPFTPHAHHQGI